MNMILRMYQFATKNRWMEKRIIWRTHNILESLVRDRDFRVPYLDGTHVYVCPTHSSGITVLNAGVHEPEIVQIIQYFVGRGYGFIDVGANIGLHTIAANAARINTHQLICAFEPEDENFERLEKNCKTNRFETTICIKAALGDEIGMKTMFLSATKNKGRHSLVKREGTIDPGYQVSVETLDDFFSTREMEVQQSTLIKIDVEGFEFFTLLGAQNTLTNLADGVIVVELMPGAYQKFNQVSIRKIFDLLESVGFDNVKVVNEQKSVRDGIQLVGETVDLVFFKGKALGLLEELDPACMIDIKEVGGIAGIEAYYSAQSDEKVQRVINEYD